LRGVATDPGGDDVGYTAGTQTLQVRADDGLELAGGDVTIAVTRS
jgi:hypothetical protein